MATAPPPIKALRRELDTLRLRRRVAGSNAGLRRIYLKSTSRQLTTEILNLRLAGKGPGFHVGKSRNNATAYYYDADVLISFFGGEDALFHREDHPELFRGKRNQVSVRWPYRRDA